MKRRPKRRGRPPKLDDTMFQVTLRVPREVIDVVDQLSSSRLDRPDRSTVMREALGLGLRILRKRDNDPA